MPLVADDDDEKPGETGVSTGTTSVESKIGPNEQAEPHGCFSIPITDPIAEPVDRPTSPSAALPSIYISGSSAKTMEQQ